FAVKAGAGDDGPKRDEETKMFHLQGRDQVLSAAQLRSKGVAEFQLIQIFQAAWLVDAGSMEDSSDRAGFGFDPLDCLRDLARIGDINGKVLEGNAACREPPQVLRQGMVKLGIRSSKQNNFAAAFSGKL